MSHAMLGHYVTNHYVIAVRVGGGAGCGSQGGERASTHEPARRT